MNKTGLIIILVILMASCKGPQQNPGPAPEPVIESHRFEKNISGMAIDREGNLYLLENPYSSSLSHIHRFEGDSLVPVFSGLPIISEIAIDFNNNFYASSGVALLHLSANGYDTIYRAAGEIRHLSIDVHQNVWFADMERGAVWYASSDHHTLLTEESDGLLNNTITSIAHDGSNTTWLGHKKGGVSRIFDNGNVDGLSGFTNQDIYSLVANNSNSMLMGLGMAENDSILMSVGYGSPKNLSPELHVSRDTALLVTDIAVDHYNRTWIVLNYITDHHSEYHGLISNDLFYLNIEWKNLVLDPERAWIRMIQADPGNRVLYVLTSADLYLVR